MRIISKFHDYYDTAMGLGQDRNLVFSRIKKQLPKEAANFSTAGTIRKLHSMDKKKKKSIHCDPITILFCGKEYHGIKVQVGDYLLRSFIFFPAPDVHYFYDADALRDFLQTFDIDITVKPRHYQRYQRVSPRSYYDQCVEWFSPTVSRSENAMISGGYSILLQDDTVRPSDPKIESTWISNPILREIEFYKIVDPFTAFQELSMWIGGVLPTPGRDMVNIEDKYRIAQHGFDKWSFRKQSKNV